MRTKAQHAEVAKAIAGLRGANGPVVAVLATPGFKMPKTKPALASFGCTTCGSHFAAIKGSQPFCVTCGGEDVTVDDAAEDTPTEELDDDKEELSGVVCCHCNTTNIVSNKTLAVLAGSMHCIVCGADMEFDEVPDADRGAAVDPEVVDQEAGGDDFTSQTELSGDTNKVNLNQTEGQDDLDPPVGVENENQTTLPLIDPNDDTVDVAMDEINPDDINPDDIDVIQTSSVAYALVNGVTVATMSAETAGVNADLVSKASLPSIVKSAVEKAGLKAGLKQVGFVPVVAKVPFKSLVEKAALAKTQDTQKKLDAQAATLRDDLHQALVIAMAGMQKNFFRGKENALKSALFDELTASGVTHAAKLIDRVFRNHGGEYLSSLLELAEELRQKPVDVRNALAAAVDSANYVAADLDDANRLEDEEDDEDDFRPTNTEAVTSRLHRQSATRIVREETASHTGGGAAISRERLFGMR